MQRIVIDSKTRVLALTGAGVSAESGIQTFRASNGLWNNHPVEKVATPEGFRDDPLLVWQFYSERRRAAKSCVPNPGHLALAQLESALGDRFLLATQNVDGLHLRAGSQRVIEMHGNLLKSRCSVCDRPPFDDDEAYTSGILPACGRCQSAGRSGILRPHIVWFGEALDPEHLERIERFMATASRARWLFVAVGTSGVVYPAAALVDVARGHGAETWLVNAEPSDNASHFEHFVQGTSGSILPALFDVR